MHCCMSLLSHVTYLHICIFIYSRLDGVSISKYVCHSLAVGELDADIPTEYMAFLRKYSFKRVSLKLCFTYRHSIIIT